MLNAGTKSTLERLRDKADLSQQKLADKIGTSQSQIDRLEKGLRKMTPQWAKRLAPALECHWLELMDETPPAQLEPQEAALLGRVRELAETDRETVYRIAEALAETGVKR